MGLLDSEWLANSRFHGKSGRPAVPKEIRQLICTLRRDNPLWGAPHIHGELKPGNNIGETSVSTYMLEH